MRFPRSAPAPSHQDPSRRGFLQGLVSSALAAPFLIGCRASYPVELLGYQGLAELPFFAVDGDGRLRLTVDVPPITDVHAHLGIAIFSAPDLDLNRSGPRTQYLMNCDERQPPCTVNLDKYLNEIATPDMLEEMEQEVQNSVFSMQGSKAAATHTIPNLLAEMDALRIERAILLPIASGLPVRDQMTERWREAVLASGHKERFVSFCSVHPKHQDALDQLRAYRLKGYAGLKFHPTMQEMAPDDPAALALFAECDRLGMPVFLHAGRAGIEPEFVQGFAEIERYRRPVSELPDLPFVFGHSGARDWEGALALAKEHPNVWMDTQGQAISHVRRMLDELGSERLLFGSDWPWYPQAVSLAKVLIATDGDLVARDRILCHNAARLLAG